MTGRSPKVEVSHTEGLVERLQTEFLPPAEQDTDPALSAKDRILDAATRRFTVVGVDATTMSSIAAEANLSREWLYRHFSNRDALVAGVLQRELRRFIDGLAIRASDNGDVTAALTDAFVYSVEFLRDQQMLVGIIDHDMRLASTDLRNHAGALVAIAVRTCAGYLTDPGGYQVDEATFIAETLTRLVGSTILAPRAVLDLHDEDTLRKYAARVVSAIVG